MFRLVKNVVKPLKTLKNCMTGVRLLDVFFLFCAASGSLCNVGVSLNVCVSNYLFIMQCFTKVKTFKCAGQCVYWTGLR